MASIYAGIAKYKIHMHTQPHVTSVLNALMVACFPDLSFEHSVKFEIQRFQKAWYAIEIVGYRQKCAPVFVLEFCILIN